jgi:hypothetical protein
VALWVNSLENSDADSVGENIEVANPTPQPAEVPVPDKELPHSSSRGKSLDRPLLNQSIPSVPAVARSSLAPVPVATTNHSCDAVMHESSSAPAEQSPFNHTSSKVIVDHDQQEDDVILCESDEDYPTSKDCSTDRQEYGPNATGVPAIDVKESIGAVIRSCEAILPAAEFASVSKKLSHPPI